MHDEQIKTYFDGSFYALYLEYKGEVDVPLSFSVFMRSKPFWGEELSQGGELHLRASPKHGASSKGPS